MSVCSVGPVGLCCLPFHVLTETEGWKEWETHAESFCFGWDGFSNLPPLDSDSVILAPKVRKRNTGVVDFSVAPLRRRQSSFGQIEVQREASFVLNRNDCDLVTPVNQSCPELFGVFLEMSLEPVHCLLSCDAKHLCCLDQLRWTRKNPGIYSLKFSFASQQGFGDTRTDSLCDDHEHTVSFARVIYEFWKGSIEESVEQNTLRKHWNFAWGWNGLHVTSERVQNSDEHIAVSENWCMKFGGIWLHPMVTSHTRKREIFECDFGKIREFSVLLCFVPFVFYHKFTLPEASWHGVHKTLRPSLAAGFYNHPKLLCVRNISCF